jgi:hypothetical protein
VWCYLGLGKSSAWCMLQRCQVRIFCSLKSPLMLSYMMVCCLIFFFLFMLCAWCLCFLWDKHYVVFYWCSLCLGFSWLCCGTNASFILQQLCHCFMYIPDVGWWVILHVYFHGRRFCYVNLAIGRSYMSCAVISHRSTYFFYSSYALF